MSATLLSLTLPTFDLRRFDANAAERTGFLRDLRAAARHLGFFYLVGHGIDGALIADVLTLSRRFFALPEEEKLAIEKVNSPHFRGYNRAGFEHTRGKPDWREQVDIGSERPALPVDRSASPIPTRCGRRANWPNGSASVASGRCFVGGPAKVADELQEWVEKTDVDGFNLAYAVTDETFSDIVAYLVPELQRRGVYKKDYAPGTPREKLFGSGPRLPQNHVGARYRSLAADVLSAAE
jgi:non-haem dioxygenase in morphine synthesis N-terminal